MTPPLIFAAISQFWFAVPLIVVVSLVYAATRHEAMRPILAHAGRTGFWISSFMVVVFFLLSLLSWGL